VRPTGPSRYFFPSSGSCVAGVAAPIAIAGRIGENRVSFSSGHSPLQAAVSILKFSTYQGGQVSYSQSTGGSALFQATSNLGPGERYKIGISFNNGQNWQTLAGTAPSPTTFSVPAANTYSNRPPRADIRVTSLTVPTLRALGSLRIQY
jgi:hypothetical protein